MAKTQRPRHPSRSRWFDICPRISAFIAALVGIAVLVGWCLDVAYLKSVVPGWVSMKANTALALLASGLALWAGAVVPTSHCRRLIKQVLAGSVALLGTLTLVEYVFQVDLGIDQLLFADQPASALTTDPGRMAPATALCTLFCGVSLLVLGSRPRVSHNFAYLTLLITLTALVGYVFSVDSLYTVGAYTSMAVHTALTFMLLGIGILAAQSTSGFVSILSSDTAGGTVSRNLLATIPLAVLSIGGVLMAGEARGYYDSRFTLALMATLSIVILACVIARIATRLHRVDRSRDEARAKLSAFNLALERRVVDRTKELEAVNASLLAEVGERQRAEEEVRRLSLTDELTGLHNRRSFFLLAPQNLRAARRANLVSQFFFVDLDGLKLTNDTYGHEAGDLVIAAAAQVLKECFRECDVVARIGGDEFVILATCGDESAQAIAARLQAQVAQFNASGLCRYRLALSIGFVSCLPQELKPLGELLASADAMMYENKQQRRQASRNTSWVAV
jgi:diguanylate cyclase (GGDEF)-like protein